MFITSTWSCSMTCWFLSSCPTSNHNNASADPRNEMLYIVLFLHQTTTTGRCIRIIPSCISYYSYIKPQHAGGWQSWLLGCISYYSYIKPQQPYELSAGRYVVYRTIPTSNHNITFAASSLLKLYIVLFLHQTTTLLLLWHSMSSCISYYSYIKPQLMMQHSRKERCCISYYSYIKPQLHYAVHVDYLVVYRTIPTSNHNLVDVLDKDGKLYIVLFLHQTTTL